ncbi:hypothetical protein BV22DRAFT_445681 [Leucogyrophana mollusca]|uniref:Uncharacterized protein n=1 Tax=Leucogyrophana mollusca TaxID=85980 RepID=A0ACB8BIT8_9AGAM|nr:hypothetical protein BV22DRAFT_445681 [Leucogyrophana mollusca]
MIKSRQLRHYLSAALAANPSYRDICGPRSFFFLSPTRFDPICWRVDSDVDAQHTFVVPAAHWAAMWDKLSPIPCIHNVDTLTTNVLALFFRCPWSSIHGPATVSSFTRMMHGRVH